MQSKKNKKYTYIDLFSGAGGFSLGFEKANFRNIFSIDVEKSFCDTYKANFPSHKLLEIDIKNLKVSHIKKLVGKTDVDVIIGGPPCQGFSMAGNIGRKFTDDPRNHLFKEFVRVVKVVRPKFFVMENVARLYTHNLGKTKEEIKKEFEKIGYRLESRVLNTADYGIPQARRRVIFIGTRTSNKIWFPPAKNVKKKSVRDAIGDLPGLDSGHSHDSIANHTAMKHSEQMLLKMKYIKDGGDRSAIPEGLRPLSGDVRKYIRYNSAKPSITITGDMRKVFHYDQNRALTVWKVPLFL